MVENFEKVLKRNLFRKELRETSFRLEVEFKSKLLIKSYCHTLAKKMF